MRISLNSFASFENPLKAFSNAVSNKIKFSKSDRGVPKPKFEPRNYDQSQAFEKMKKNAIRAAEEHWHGNEQLLLRELDEMIHNNKPSAEEEKFLDNLKNAIESQKKRRKIETLFGCLYGSNINQEQVYATASQSIASLSDKCDKPLLFSKVGKASKQGPRPTMEDAHFSLQSEEGDIVVGVFDGHGGKDVAEYASKAFKGKVLAKINEFGGNVHRAFEHLCYDIQNDIFQKPHLDGMGSTAIVSVMNQKSGLLTTMTVADAEGFIFRKIDGQLKAIPLSPLRTWASPNDRTRLGAQRGLKPLPGRSALSSNQVFGQITNNKIMRSYGWSGVNVARAFGDKLQNPDLLNPVLSVKPKISVHRVLPGDIVLHCCDGLPDYAEMGHILQEIEKMKYLTSKEIAQHLANWVTHRKGGQDNVTILITKIT